MTNEQVATFVKIASQGAPVILGKYVAGKVRTFKKVDEKSGRTEVGAGLIHAVLCGREVLNVKTYVDRDPELLQKAVAAEGNDALTDKLLPAKPGADVVVAIRGYKYEKGAVVVSGEIQPL